MPFSSRCSERTRCKQECSWYINAIVKRRIAVQLKAIVLIVYNLYNKRIKKVFIQSVCSPVLNGSQSHPRSLVLTSGKFKSAVTRHGYLTQPMWKFSRPQVRGHRARTRWQHRNYRHVAARISLTSGDGYYARNYRLTSRFSPQTGFK